MILHSDALKIVLDTGFKTKVEPVSIFESVGRILAEDLIASFDMPPFNKSMVDGYACLRNDIRSKLILRGVIAAGDKKMSPVEKGICYKIMTGAPVPEGTEMVVMVEDAVESANKVEFINPGTSSNIALQGEDFRKGDLILPKGTLLKPFHCGIIATLGIDEIKVFSMAKVGIMVTGDEIVEPGGKLENGQIFNANAAQIINYCRSINCVPRYYGIIPDTLQDTSIALEKGISENDALIITGGVSMGDYDYVSEAIKKSGLEVLFESIAAQPGRPLIFAKYSDKFCFGMPGNPVSGLVLFETIVKPLLMQIMGFNGQKSNIGFKLSESITRKKAQRKSFYPVKLINPEEVEPIKYNGSAHINSYSEAFGILSLEIGEFEKKKGEIVYVRPV
ncbi:MAG: molybdopterin molybdotransferase MoeA [Deltaproteobacteria bacterium]